MFFLSTKQLAIKQNHPHRIVEELTENVKQRQYRNESCSGGGGGQPLTLLSTTFDRQGTPFVYLSLTNGTPYPLHTSLELFIPSTAMTPDSF